jgi:peroxiredoxin family protein
MLKRNKKDKVILILHNGDWDRVYYGLSIAVAALSSGKEVHALFTFGALKRLVKGHADDLSTQTSEEIQGIVQKGPLQGKIPSIAEMLQTAGHLGLKMYACPAAMSVLGLSKEQLIPGVDTEMGLVGFLEICKGAILSFYI